MLADIQDSMEYLLKYFSVARKEHLLISQKNLIISLNNQ